MADDIFLSPEEQDERARQWFKDNAPALAIGIALGLAAVVGYNKFQDNQIINAESASNFYQEVVNEMRDSELSSIDEQVNALKNEHAKTAYAAKAVLLKAKQTSVNDLSAAFNELQWVVDNAPDAGLKHVARIRQAKIKLAQNEFDVARTLASYTPTEGFESHYQEVLGDIAVKDGQEEQARAHYQAAVDALEGTQDTYVQVLNIKLDRLPVDVSEKTPSISQGAETQGSATESSATESSATESSATEESALEVEPDNEPINAADTNNFANESDDAISGKTAESDDQ